MVKYRLVTGMKLMKDILDVILFKNSISNDNYIRFMIVISILVVGIS